MIKSLEHLFKHLLKSHLLLGKIKQKRYSPNMFVMNDFIYFIINNFKLYRLELNIKKRYAQSSIEQDLKYFQMLKSNLSLRCSNEILNIIAIGFIIPTINSKVAVEFIIMRTYPKFCISKDQIIIIVNNTAFSRLHWIASTISQRK